MRHACTFNKSLNLMYQLGFRGTFIGVIMCVGSVLKCVMQKRVSNHCVIMFFIWSVNFLTPNHQDIREPRSIRTKGYEGMREQNFSIIKINLLKTFTIGFRICLIFVLKKPILRRIGSKFGQNDILKNLVSRTNTNASNSTS